jgi:DNA repair exonuclease SbcCD ATPase subunit
VANLSHAWQLESKESLMTPSNAAQDSIDVTTRLEQQGAALRQTEEALREQRDLITRMMAELKQIQDSARTPRNDDMETVLHENEQVRQANEHLRHALVEYERAALEPKPRSHHDAATEKQVQELRAELKLLQQILDDKNVMIEELRSQAGAPVVKIDVDSYEAELMEFRRQLESDREKLKKEIEELRARNQELDQATREMELEMSRERADLARERQRLERSREEMRLELERAQRSDGGMRDRLAPVQRLREEINVKQPQTTPAPLKRPGVTNKAE